MSGDNSWRGGSTLFRRSAQTGEAGSPGRGPTSAVRELPGQGGDKMEVKVDVEADADELREFLSADWLDVKADPTFREKLRDQLWQMIRDRNGISGEDEED